MLQSGEVKLPASRAVPATSSAGLFTLAYRAPAERKESERNRVRRADRMSPPVFLRFLSYFLGRRFVRGIGHEEGIELAGDEPTAGRVLTDDVQYVFSVEPAGLAQERLGAVVVVLGPVLELPVEAAVGPDGVPGGSGAHVVLVGYGPTGERTGAGLHVVLVIGPDAHGEQLQQLPAEVLVGRAFMVVLVVQPEDHCRVPGQLRQQVAKRAQPVTAERVDLVGHGLGVVQLAVGRGEETVPEQGDFLLQGPPGVYHPVHPVRL